MAERTVDITEAIDAMEGEFDDDYDGHFFCTGCFPALKVGDLYTSLCGVTKTAKFVLPEALMEQPPCETCIRVTFCRLHGSRVWR